MIILFEENETVFQSLGLGLLKDARSCYVGETINDSFELELVYPKTGALFSQIKLNRIIFTKPNPYSEPQPFRIYSISKPINGVITVKAVHISYDMNGLVVAPVSGTSAKQTLDKIQNGSLTKHNFKLYTDLVSTKSFTTNNYYNMRALLLGSEDSVLEKYKGEISFDKFNVYINERRGSNKGAQVRYAKNMKDINHEINYERLYNGVYPFYHQETTETVATTSTDGFKQVYIVGSKPFQDGWLSYNADGDPYHPVDESPVQIASDGDYFGKVYTWNATTQRYGERIYNEMVNLVECVTGAIGITDKPNWIYIDVSALPTVVVRANESGYFKLVTDTEWTYRAKGEVVYQGSITNIGESLMLYYSEVIPTVTEAKESTTTSVTHVELKDKIIYLDTPAAKDMKFDRILCLDLTSEFDETPDEDKLKLKAEEYIEKNKIGQYKYETTVSFIDLANTTEGTTCEKMESIELGDTVKVVYEGLGIDIELRVITTKYNAILDRYDSIELGEKPDKLSANSVQTGDNVSSLINDVGYTDITTVNKLIAKTITADLIQAKNAKLSKAQIEELQTARIKITGMIEATQFELDKLVAKMLVADNAEIKHVLEAGEIKVKGDITVTSGEITLINKETGTVFKVDRNGNVEANSVKITGGELNINDAFSVTPEGILTAHGAEISGNVTIESGSIKLGNKFEVTEDGTVTASGATISGTITADAGAIAGFNISKYTPLGSSTQIGRIYIGVETIDDTSHNGVYIGTDGIRLGPNFKVDKEGNVTALTMKFMIPSTAASPNPVIEYATNSSNTTPPITGWTTTIPSVAQGDYLWTRMTTYYNDNTSSISYITSYQGEDGTSVEIRGNVDTYSDLLLVTGMSDGDVYIVDDASDDTSIPSGKPTDGILYIYHSATTSWSYSGQIKGPQGEIGPRGYSIIMKNSAALCTSIGDSYIDTDDESNTFGHLFQLQGYTEQSEKIWLDCGDVMASVTWASVTATFPQAASNAKGIYYALNPYTQENEVLIKATAGEIANFKIYNNVLQADNSSGTRVLVSPGKSFVISGISDTAKYWSFLAGATFTTSENVDTYTDAKFAVTRDGDVWASNLNIRGGTITIQNNSVTTFSVSSTGHVYTSDISIEGGQIIISDNGQVQFRVTSTGQVTASNMHINGGEITLGNIGSYSLSSLSQINVQYTVLENISGVESGDYEGVMSSMSLTSLRQEALPEDCGTLHEGTLVPVFDVEFYDGDEHPGQPDGIDTWWYIGTTIYSGTEYDMWVKVEDPDAGGYLSFNTSDRKILYCTKVVTVDTTAGAYFRVDNEGNVTATSVNVSGEIHSGKGSLAGFTLTETSLYTGFTGSGYNGSKGVYLGTDSIRLGDNVSRSFTSGSFVIQTGMTAAGNTVSIVDSNHLDENYAGSTFLLNHPAQSTDRVINVAACDDDYDVLYDSHYWIKQFTIKAGTTSTEIILQNSQYFRFWVSTGNAIGTCTLSLKILPGFIVNANGDLYCMSATVRGKIIAETGTIAGFDIQTSKLYYVNPNDSNDRVYLGTDKIELGSASAPKFRVTNAGVLTADNATFSNINITSGSITLSDTYNSVSMGPRSGTFYGGISFSNSLRGQIDMGFGYSNAGVIARSTVPYQILNYYDDVGSGNETYIQLECNKPSSDFQLGIQLVSVSKSNTTYGIPGGSVFFSVGRVWRSGNTVYGFDKDACINGQFRNWASEPALGCAGYSTSNSSSNNVSLDTRANQSKTLAMWCARFTVGGDAWVAVPKDFSNHTIRAVIVSRYHGGSLGGYHYGAFYKIENGYVYIGNDDSSTTCDVVIIYEI